MHFLLSTLWTLLPSLIVTTTGLPHTTRNDHTLVVHNITQFPDGTFVENLAIRPNGQALVTLLNTPELHLVDPHGGGSHLVHQFPEVTGLTGIAEVEDDVFAVVAGNFSLKTAQTTPGSYSVWKVDMRPFRLENNTPAVVTKITAIPQASLLNGMIALDGNGNVLIADSTAGVVWRLDTRSGGSQIVIDDPLMKPPAGGVAIGVNGLNIFNNVLYFTNSFAFTFNRVPINPDGTASGAAQTVAQCPGCDDFTMDPHGDAFIAQNSGNALLKITSSDGSSTVLVGGLNSTELAGPTSAHFSRKGHQESSVLYVTTCGGLASPVNGTFVEGGKVVAIDVHG